MDRAVNEHDTEAIHAEFDRDGSRPERSRSTNRYALYAVIAITLAGMATVVYGTFANVTDEPIDAPTQRIAAQACASAYNDLKRLSPLTPNATFNDRAILTEHENAIFTTLANRVSTTHPTDHDGSIALTAWIGDWRSLIQRRANYAKDLRAIGNKAEPDFPKDTSGAPVTNRMNQFSRTHNLIGCATHNLQAEIVDGLRAYPNDPTQVP